MAVNKENNTQVLVTFPNDMLEKIQEYWHENHLQNRSTAIRELVQKGLDTQK